jgi:uncharacterized membrane protein YeiH
VRCAKGKAVQLQGPFTLPPFFDYAATFLYAISGALIAARRHYDFSGILALALVSSTGGGLLRDGLFLQSGPPLLLRTPVYLALIGIATTIIVSIGPYVLRLPFFEQVVALMDALGLGAYGIVGLQFSVATGLGLPAAVFVGVVNAVGGGLLRDVLVRREPDVFKPGTPAASAALVGCLLFLLLTRLLRVGETLAALIAIGVVFSIRALALQFDLRTRPLRGFDHHAPG